MTKDLRAILLAAGFGTRLRPLTLSTPKCLVNINSEPLLGLWINKLKKVGCESIIVNTHYLSDQVFNYLEKNHADNNLIRTVHEPELLGTAGTLLANISFFTGYTGILIHADNFMLDDLHGLLDAHAHRPTQCLLTMLTFSTSNPSSCGIVEIDENNIVQCFHEKVSDPPSNLANGAIYVFDDDFLDFIRSIVFTTHDFSLDVLPLLMGKIYTWQTTNPFLDIGTPASLAEAQIIYSNYSQPSS